MDGELVLLQVLLEQEQVLAQVRVAPHLLEVLRPGWSKRILLQTRLGDRSVRRDGCFGRCWADLNNM